MKALWDDLFAGLSAWRSTPLLALVAIATLALGIAVTTVVYSVAKTVLLRPLPFAEPAGLVIATSTQGSDEAEWPLSHPDFLDRRQRSRSFTGLTAVGGGRLVKLRTADGPVLLSAEMVSARYFEVLGILPLRGRVFLPGEDRVPGEGRVAVVSHRVWRDRWGGNPGLIGKQIELDEISYQVVGVLPPRAHGLNGQADVWVPVSMAATLGGGYLDSRKFRWLSAVGRLRPGLDVEAARRDLAGVARQLAGEYPETNLGIGSHVVPLEEALRGRLRAPLLALSAASLCVLLVACANVTNLLFARGVKRRREVAIRAALGASPGRLRRELLAESWWIALLSWAVGLGIAWQVAPRLFDASGFERNSFVGVELDPTVVGLALALSLLCSLIAAIPPLRLLKKNDLHPLLHEGGSGMTLGRSFLRLQSVLIPVEIASAAVLLVGGSLMTQGFLGLVGRDLGFDPEKVLVVEASTQGKAYADDARYRALVQETVQRIGALPEVEAAALEGPGVPAADWHGMTVTLEERRPVPTDEVFLAVRHHVTPGYFKALGVPVLQGRGITAADHERAIPVVVISQRMAKALWPEAATALGKRFKFQARDSEFPWLTVVGVVADVHHEGLHGERPGLDMYLSLVQIIPRNPPLLHLLVRSPLPAEKLAPLVRGELARAAPDLPIVYASPMADLLSHQVAGSRFLALLMNLFAAFAVAFSVVGIYGVISWLVLQRIPEIGVRIALGADRAGVLRAVSWPVVRLITFGLAIGTVLVQMLLPLLRSRMEGLSSPHPLLIGGALLLLAAVALLACYIPARRAARIDPRAALQPR
jgi:putative ABC transport system permease protein